MYFIKERKLILYAESINKKGSLMKRSLIYFGLSLLIIGFASAQRANIKVEPISPHMLETMGLPTNSVASGLKIVPNGTYVYLSSENIADTNSITNTDFTIVSKPAGSAASVTMFTDDFCYILLDVKGEYEIKCTITTVTGTDDTTMSIYSADYVGVGNFGGVPASYPNCMTCHAGMPDFADIFNRWEVSGHASIFKTEITTGASYYGPSCFPCHTTGYDHYVAADNNGFDDIAADLGWQWFGPPDTTKWDSLVTFFPELVNHATIGCENCHGPGSEHASSTLTEEIQISVNSGSCMQCHDEPWRHNKVSEWENSGHSEVPWTGSFAQGPSSQNNSLSNCIRCHDGNGFVNFTKDRTTNTTDMIEADLEMIGCAACHDPHGNDNEFSLRDTPAGSDTLANGMQYTIGGKGMLCMNCHKGRRNSNQYTLDPPSSSHWGPHHSTQTDMFLGENAAEFGTPFSSGTHYNSVSDACVTCHMVATTDTGTVNRDKVGGHSFNLYNEETGYYHTTACANCHGTITSWDDFQAFMDYDVDGTVESVPQEIDGLLKSLRTWLPPVGIDSIDYNLVAATGDVNFYKAYYNYQFVEYDGSHGMHNSKYAISVLLKSIEAIGGIVPVETDLDNTPKDFVLSQNYPNPFNPSTVIRYSIPVEGKVKLMVYNIAGETVTELVNENQRAGIHEVTFDLKSAGKQLSTGVYLYSIEVLPSDGTKIFRQTRKMVLLK